MESENIIGVKNRVVNLYNDVKFINKQLFYMF